jgi:hypothetical protein
MLNDCYRNAPTGPNSLSITVSESRPSDPTEWQRKDPFSLHTTHTWTSSPNNKEERFARLKSDWARQRNTTRHTCAVTL